MTCSTCNEPKNDGHTHCARCDAAVLAGRTVCTWCGQPAAGVKQQFPFSHHRIAARIREAGENARL